MLLCILTTRLFLSFHYVVNGDHWPTWGSLELEQSCAGSPLVTDVRHCPGLPHRSPSHTPSSPRPLSAHYGSVCSVSSPGRTCRWSHRCWNLAEKWKNQSTNSQKVLRQSVNPSTQFTWIVNWVNRCGRQNKLFEFREPWRSFFAHFFSSGIVFIMIHLMFWQYATFLVFSSCCLNYEWKVYPTHDHGHVYITSSSVSVS